MCTGYNSDSCCLPIHQTEISDAYTHMVSVAHQCIQTLSQEHPELRQYFCLYCNPNMLSYFSCCHDWEWVTQAGSEHKARRPAIALGVAMSRAHAAPPSPPSAPLLTGLPVQQ